MAATSIISRREGVGKGSASSVPKSPAESRRPSNSSERDVSFAHEGFEYVGIVTAAVTDVAARINPCRTTERKAKIRRQKVVAIQACSRDLRSISSRDEEEEKESQKRDVAKEERNSGVAPLSSGERRAREKKSIPMSLGGGARYMYRRGCRRLPLQRRTGAQMIIRRHGNARPIARPDASCMDILIPFTHPLPHSPILSNPLSNDPRRIPPSSLLSRRFEAERMALVKPCFLPFEDLRPGALATLEARENPTMQG